MEHKAVVPASESRSIAPIAEMDEGAVFHPGDLRAIVRVVQGPGAGASAGRFRYLDTGEERLTLRVVVLLIQATRVKWPSGGFSRDARPECWSTDGARGARGAMFEAHECLRCRYFVAQPRTGDRDQGLCLPTYAVVLYDDNRQDPVVMRLTGTMARVAPQLYGGRRDPHLRARWLELSTTRVEGARGSYYALVVTRQENLTADQRTEMRAFFERARAVELALQPEEMDEDETPGEAPAGRTERPGMITERPDDDFPF